MGLTFGVIPSPPCDSLLKVRDEGFSDSWISFHDDSRLLILGSSLREDQLRTEVEGHKDVMPEAPTNLGRIAWAISPVLEPLGIDNQ